MEISFYDYVFVILDFSALFSALSDDLLLDLSSHPDVYVSKTFNTECEQVKKLANSSLASKYQRNIKFLKSITTKYLPYDDLSADIDTFGLAKYFAYQDVDFVVLTANQIIIQQIVLNNVRADIYNVNSNKLLRFNSFNSAKRLFELSPNKVLLDCSFAISKGTILHRRNGSLVTLSNEYNSKGTEAVIYEIVGDTKNLAKIYRDKKLTAEKFDNIKKLIKLNSTIKLTWCAFPIAILYYDKSLKQPIGYIMPFAKDINLLSDDELFAGQVFDILHNHRETRISYTIELCLKIVRQILFLNMHGVVVSDFNDANFGIHSDNPDRIMMLDTDSFGFREYFSDCRAQYDEYTRAYDFLKKNEAINFSYESLSIFIFKLLSLGLEPLYKGNFRFRENRINHGNDFKWDFFPQNLKKLFLSIFDANKPCSISVLIYELQIANQKLKKEKSTNKTYRELCTDILDSTRADYVGTEFTCVLTNISGDEPWLLVNCVEEIPVLMEERYDINEIIYFKTNDDNTYTITSKGEDGRLLSLSASVQNNKSGAQVIFNEPSSGYAQKWRIEQKNKWVTDDGHEQIDCVIGSELYPNFVIDINDEKKLCLIERSTNEERDSQQLSIYKVTETEHCIKNTEEETTQKEKRRKIIITVAVIVAAIIVVSAITFFVYYLNNRYSNFVNYIGSNTGNILFVGGMSEELQIQRDYPKFDKDSLSLYSSDYAVIGIENESIVAMGEGVAQIGVASNFTNRNYSESWYALKWNENDVLNLFKGESYDLYSQISPRILTQISEDYSINIRDNISTLVIIASSDESIVTADKDGYIIAIDKGSVIVDIKQGDIVLQSYSIEVRVNVKDIWVNNTSITLEMGEVFQLEVRLLPEGADTSVTYYSSGLEVSSSGLIKAPAYNNDYGKDDKFYVKISADSVSKEVTVNVINSYTWKWHDDEMYCRDDKYTPIVFDSIIPNCTGLRLGHRILTTTDEYNFNSDYLGRYWGIYTYDGKGGTAQRVGQIQMTQKDQFEYVDLNFSKRNVWAIFVIPGNNIYSPYTHSVDISNLNYNGHVH